MIERSRVRIAAGTVGEFSSPGSTFCAEPYCGIQSTLTLLQWHAKDLAHSAKNAVAGYTSLVVNICSLLMSYVASNSYKFNINGIKLGMVVHRHKSHKPESHAEKLGTNYCLQLSSRSRLQLRIIIKI